MYNVHKNGTKVLLLTCAGKHKNHLPDLENVVNELLNDTSLSLFFFFLIL